MKRTSTAVATKPTASIASARLPRGATAARSAALATFEQRIRRAVERAAATGSHLTQIFHAFGFDPLAEPGAVEGMAERFTAHVEKIVAAYNVPLRTRGAVLARLAEHWHFIHGPERPPMYDRPYASELEFRRALWASEGAENVAAEETHGVLAGAWEPRIIWPSNVSMDDVAAVVARSDDPDAREIARSLRAGQWFTAGTNDRRGLGVYLPGTLHPRPELYEPDPDEPGWGRIASRTLDRALGSYFHPMHAGLIAWAEKVIAEDQRSARFFPLPASQKARVPFEVMARGGSYADGSRELWRARDDRGVVLRVVWDGKPRGEQLSLAFAVRGVVQAGVFRDILRELKAEGLRDYVILHRMAAEQGRTGRLFWTWEAHKRATVHERRVSDGNKNDAAARDAVMNTIRRLAAAELHAEVERNGSRAWKVVGEAPLVNIVGGVAGHLEGLELVLNPALYDGARADGSDDLQRYFTQLPEAVLSLPSLPFCLAVMLGFRFRYAQDEGGAVVLRAEELHAFVDAARWRVGNRTDADATLQRAMVDVARAMGEGCTFEPVEGESYRVTPPRAWVDAVIHEVPPELPPSRSKTPRNGAELLAWREARDLSQTGAAKALGVSVRTVKRAEKRRASTLPRSFRAADWNALPLSKSLPPPSDE